MTDEPMTKTIEVPLDASVLWLIPKKDGSFDLHVDVGVEDDEVFTDKEVTPRRAAALAIYRAANYLTGARPEKPRIVRPH